MKYLLAIAMLMFSSAAYSATIDSANVDADTITIMGEFPLQPCVKFGGEDIPSYDVETQDTIIFPLPGVDPGSYRVSVGHVTENNECRGYRRNGITVTIGAQGVQGIQGFEGPQGSQGTIGPEGLPGVQGVQGAIGPIGFIGPQGTQGAIGPQGQQGVAGPPGETPSLVGMCLAAFNDQFRIVPCQ